jgi:(heptosyl)LPS beta-1,4-glucosyltransferase
LPTLAELKDRKDMVPLVEGQATGTLGVVAICKNEEQDLPGFFANFLPWVDEIVIVDDNSSDQSTSIIRSAGPKVRLIEHPMNSTSGFSGQRNVGMEGATADWLIHTDIDERASPELAAEIRSAIENTQLNGFSYRRRNYFLHQAMLGCGLQDWNKPQLARRGKHHFRNRVHEECVIDCGPAATGQMDHFMLHLNDENYKERLEKSVVYCQELSRRIAGRGFRIRWWHLILFPFGEFLRKYLLKSGYRDGVRGLIFCLHSGCAVFKATALVWDEQNRIDRDDVETQLEKQWQKSSLRS